MEKVDPVVCRLAELERYKAQLEEKLSLLNTAIQAIKENPTFDSLIETIIKAYSPF